MYNDYPEELRTRILRKLLIEPGNILKQYIVDLMVKIVEELELPSNGAYCLVFRGRNFLLPSHIDSWHARDIHLPLRYESEFISAITMQENLAEETLLISNYIQQIFNHAEHASDVHYLMDEVLREDFMINSRPITNPSDSAIHWEKEIHSSDPDPVQAIKKRILTNALISKL